jgi:hypothetical protein
MKTLRIVHLYLGIFLAPSIFFLALTGALQTFSLHESERGSSYVPPSWIVRLAQVHKKQSIQAPPPRPVGKLEGGPKRDNDGPPSANGDRGAASAAPAARNDAAKPSNAGPRRLKVSWPLKWFFLFVSLGLATTTALGLWMSFQMRRETALLLGLLLAGLVVPVGLAFL